MEALGRTLLVGLGGGLGSMARYLMSGWVHRFAGPAWPVGTLFVNVSGSLAIGVLGGLIDARGGLGPGLRIFLMVGVLGGYTTFSSFAFETLALARGAWLPAGLNVLAQVLLGLIAAWAGLALGRSLG